MSGTATQQFILDQLLVLKGIKRFPEYIAEQRFFTRTGADTADFLELASRAEQVQTPEIHCGEPLLNHFCHIAVDLTFETFRSFLNHPSILLCPAESRVEAHAAASKMQASPSRDYTVQTSRCPKYRTIQKYLQHMMTMVTMGHHWEDTGDVTGGSTAMLGFTEDFLQMFTEFCAGHTRCRPFL
jgi:hypothetical protein